MNNIILAGNIILLSVMLTLSGIVPAGTILPPISSTSPPVSSTSPSGTDNVTRTVDTLEQAMTVIKNEKLEVSGNLFGGLNSAGTDALSLNLLDNPIGDYGFLDISAGGAFRYVLRNDLPQVQALGFGDLAQEVFHYQIKDSIGVRTEAQLTIFILGNPSVSFDNVEIEPNNTSNLAGPLHAGNPVQTGQPMRGQLTTANDRDWFVVSSLGNEIINLELCPEGSQCVDEEAWVMYVFDADKFAEEGNENQTIPLRWFSNDTNETLSVAQSDHIYLLLNKGLFNNSLIGIIDPCFGNQRTLDIGVGPTATPKNYLVAISSPLLRDGEDGCSSGDVVLKRPGPKLDTQNGTTEEYIVAFPFSDDQYTFKVTRTGADPFAVIQPDSTKFDAIGRQADIPKIRVNDQLFAVELQELSAASDNTPAVFGVLSTTLLNEPLEADPYLPTYNPASGVVKIPQVVIEQSGEVFSVEMLYQPGNNTLNLLRAEPLN